jgi:hypothetical protein
MQLEGIREVRDVGAHWEWLFNNADNIFLDSPPIKFLYGAVYWSHILLFQVNHSRKNKVNKGTHNIPHIWK